MEGSYYVLPVSVCLSVCLCLSTGYSKCYERIFVNFWSGELGPNNNLLDVGDDPKPLPLFCQFFYPVMHFQYSNNRVRKDSIPI